MRLFVPPEPEPVDPSAPWWFRVLHALRRLVPYQLWAKENR